jgi:uncharacterized protein DUF3375
MKLGRLLAYFDTSPALRLLKSSNAPFIVDFLYRCFKRPGRIAVPRSELLAALSIYKEEVDESYPGRLTANADEYLAHWASPDAMWLRRFIESQDSEPRFQLTPFTEDVFRFLERALEIDSSPRGTESRLRLVIETLADLVVKSSDDPSSRLKFLREQRSAIEGEIDRIMKSGEVTKYQPAQIRERLAVAVSLLRQLQGDFRGVEEVFREIAMQVQRRHVAAAESRGGILEFALDAEDVLKRDDQGASFYEFVRLILSPTETERLEGIIGDVRRIPELALQQDGLEAIQGMTAVLQAEADKVMRTNQRLSSALRRLLDGQGHAERQQLASLLREIRQSALQLAAEPPEELGFNLEISPGIESPWRRSFWSAPIVFQQTRVIERVVDEAEREAAFRSLAGLEHLDWRALRSSIDDALTRHTVVPLSQLVDATGHSGVIDVIAYLQIACDDGHIVDPMHAEDITLMSNGRPTTTLTVPRVLFTRTTPDHAQRAS